MALRPLNRCVRALSPGPVGEPLFGNRVFADVRLRGGHVGAAWALNPTPGGLRRRPNVGHRPGHGEHLRHGIDGAQSDVPASQRRPGVTGRRQKGTRGSFPGASGAMTGRTSAASSPRSAVLGLAQPQRVPVPTQRGSACAWNASCPVRRKGESFTQAGRISRRAA